MYYMYQARYFRITIPHTSIRNGEHIVTVIKVLRGSKARGPSQVAAQSLAHRFAAHCHLVLVKVPLAIGRDYDGHDCDWRRRYRCTC